MRSMYAFACVVLMVGSAAAVGGAGPLDVRLNGNSDLSSQSILERIATVRCAVLDSACVDSTCRAVAGYYWQRGYLDVDVRCRMAAAGDSAVEISIAEGLPSVLESVEIRDQRILIIRYLN